jgi:hypothetical protein
MDAISLTWHSFALRRVNQAVNGEPVAFTAHGGFGEGDGETHLPKGRKVRPVPTLRGGVGKVPGIRRMHGTSLAAYPTLTRGSGVAAGWATAPLTITWAAIPGHSRPQSNS